MFWGDRMKIKFSLIIEEKEFEISEVIMMLCFSGDGFQPQCREVVAKHWNWVSIFIYPNKDLGTEICFNSAADKAAAILERLNSFQAQEIRGRPRGYCG